MHKSGHSKKKIHVKEVQFSYHMCCGMFFSNHSKKVLLELSFDHGFGVNVGEYLNIKMIARLDHKSSIELNILLILIYLMRKATTFDVLVKEACSRDE